MHILNLFKLALTAILRNKMRSLLTMLGVIIGVASVIAMLAIGKGSDESIKAEVASLGTNVLMINPGSASEGGVRAEAGSADALKPEDAAAIREFAHSVRYVSPVVQNRAQAVFGSRNWRTTVYGVYRDYFPIRNLKVDEGTAFSESQSRSMNKVCVIGKTVAENLFGNTSPVGQIIRVDNIPFTVIGTLAAKGQGTFGQDQDDVILAPFAAVQKRVLGVEFVNQIMVSARDEQLMEQAQTEIEQVLTEKQKRVSGGENEFTVRSQSEISNILGSISQVLTILLASIACISLLVGGIGIMNIMLVSVTERTREIGLRLAVGATENAVLLQFLTEAVLLSVTGGVIGIGLGYGVATIAGILMGWPVIVTIQSVGMAFIFSISVGTFFGYYPARKASQLNPIEALRYE